MNKVLAYISIGFHFEGMDSTTAANFVVLASADTVCTTRKPHSMEPSNIKALY